MSDQDRITRGSGEPDKDDRPMNDEFLERLLKFDPEADDVVALLDHLNAQRADEEINSDTQIRRRILVHIANFCASVKGLVVLYGPLTDQERAAGADDPAGFAPMSEKQIRECLRRYEAEDLIYLEKGGPGETDLYMPTDKGMRQAGFRAWNAGIREGYGGWILERGGRRGRLIASVAAAVGRNMRLDPAYRDFTLWSVWGMRREGRAIKGRRYVSEVPIPRRGSKPGRRHFPIALIRPKEGIDGAMTLVEIFDGSFDDEEMEIICRVCSKRSDVHRINCYVTPEMLPKLLEVAERLRSEDKTKAKNTDKIAVYRIPDEGGAVAMVGLRPERIPLSVLKREELTDAESSLQWRILECVGEAGSASVNGIAEYLVLGEAEVTLMLERSERERLVTRSSQVCDGVYLYWLTDKGSKKVELDLSVNPSSFREAWLDKECLRVAARVRRRFPRHMVMNKRQLEFAAEPMPIIGTLGASWTPALLVTTGKDGDDPIAVLIAHEIGTDFELERMVEACSQERRVSQILIYAASSVMGKLKELVASREASAQIKVLRLPKSERVAKTEAREVRRREVAAEKAEAEERRVERETKRAAKKPPRTRRCDYHIPYLPDLEPIGDTAWRAFETEFNRRIGKISSNSVSPRLVVNIVLWLLEHRQLWIEYRSPIRFVFKNYDACMVGDNAFAAWLSRFYWSGLWEVLQEVVREHEPERQPEWKYIDPAKFTITQYGRWRPQTQDRERVDSGQYDDMFEELESLRLDT